MKLYLSGPMTGIAEFNYPAFHSAKEALELRGYEVLSPADLPPRGDWEWVDFMEADIAFGFAAEGFAYLDGWERSKGARIERKIAECRGLPCAPFAHWLEQEPA